MTLVSLKVLFTYHQITSGHSAYGILGERYRGLRRRETRRHGRDTKILCPQNHGPL